MKIKDILSLLITIIILGGFIYLITNRDVLAPINDISLENNNNPQETRSMSPEAISIAVGETKKVMGLEITFNGVVQDVRCPIDFQCIEAGAVNLNIRLSDGEFADTFYYSSDSIPFLFGDYLISIKEVYPELKSNEIIDQNTYVVTFYVQSSYEDVIDIPNNLDQENILPIVDSNVSKDSCVSLGGTFYPEFNECLGISSDFCEKIGGTFNECASACRNDKEAEMCTMQCVQVCEF